jgi:hypothetical protein
MSHADVLTEPMLGDASLIVKVFMTGVRKQLNKSSRRTCSRTTLRVKRLPSLVSDTMGVLRRRKAFVWGNLWRYTRATAALAATMVTVGLRQAQTALEIP